jgi:type II secretion system protein N
VKERFKKLVPYVGYPAFYVSCLVIFAYFTFPYARLKDRAVAEFNARQNGADAPHLAIDHMTSYWLSGIEAKGVHLIAPPQPPTPDGKAKPPETMTIDDAHARVSLLRLLFGTVYVSFGADAFGGDVSGYTSDADKARTISLELEGVDTSKVTPLKTLVGLPMTGTLGGTAELKLPGGKWAKASGKIDLKITGLTVGNGKAKIHDTIALPKLNAGQAVFKAEIHNGELSIQQFTAKGSDLEFTAAGKVRLRDPIGNSLAELTARFKFSDAYKNKNDMTRGLFGAPGSKVPGMFDLDPKIKSAKRPDGFYAWTLTGPLSHLTPEPAAFGRRGAGSVIRRFVR